MVVRVHFDLLWAFVMVKSCKYGRRRANLIHQANRKQRRGVCMDCEINAIEIGQGIEDGFDFVAMDLAEPGDLVIRVLVRDFGCTAVVAGKVRPVELPTGREPGRLSPG